MRVKLLGDDHVAPARESEKSHLPRAKNNAFHRGVRKTVCVHSVTILLSSLKFVW